MAQIPVEDDELRELEAVFVQAPVWRRRVADGVRRCRLQNLAARGLLQDHLRSEGLFWTLSQAGWRQIGPRHRRPRLAG